MQNTTSTTGQAGGDEPGVQRQLLLGCLVVTTAIAVLAVLMPAQVEDRRDEWAESDRGIAEQRRQAAIARRQRAAQAMCSSDLGPQVLAVWVNETTVECLNPRGRRVASFSMEDSHATR